MWKGCIRPSGESRELEVKCLTWEGIIKRGVFLFVGIGPGVGILGLWCLCVDWTWCNCKVWAVWFVVIIHKDHSCN